MKKNIIEYTSEKEYLDYLKELDSNALMNEFNACYWLKKEVKSRLKRVCRAIYNHYYSCLVDINYDDITSFDHYLIRVLLRFELFVKEQLQHINELRDYYDPKVVHSAKSSKPITTLSVLDIYRDVMKNFRHLEKIVSSFKEKTSMWMYFLYGRGDIPEQWKKDEYRNSICAVNPDGSYDYRSQLAIVYKELTRIIEDEMGYDLDLIRVAR